MEQVQEPVDVVIAWVNGDDPKHKLKIEPYLNTEARNSDDIASPTRFASKGEIFYCVASVFRFAPFVRKIFIITDQQDPKLAGFIEQNFPNSSIEIEIIDHKILFRGYESYLPVFNSLSIETCTFRIPGLSENYVYFNDDFFLVRPVTYNDWFRGDKIVAYGHWRSLPIDRLLWFIKPLKNGHKPVGFKDGMTAAARRLDYKWKYFHLEHTPHPLKRSVLERYFKVNDNVLRDNLSYKFRNAKQFNTQEILYLLMFEQGRAVLESPAKRFLYLKPVKRGGNYVTRKIAYYQNNIGVIFCCIGSLDQATAEDSSRLLEWLKQLLNIKLEVQ